MKDVVNPIPTGVAPTTKLTNLGAKMTSIQCTQKPKPKIESDNFNYILLVTKLQSRIEQ